MKLFNLTILVLCFISCSGPELKKQVVEITEEEYSEPLVKKDLSVTENLIIGDYVKYIVDPLNGLLINKEIGNLKFELLYKPNAFVALSNLNPDPITTGNFEKEMSELKDLQYYTLKMSAKNFTGELLKYNLKSMEEYDYRVNYFSFKMQNEIKLIEGKDTLDCSLFHFERNFGVAPNISFVLGFPKQENETLVYNKTISFDENVFGTGKVNMTISKENIINIPGVKIN